MTSPLRCAPNFRDLGNTPAHHGRLIKPGLIFRSETLINPNNDDRAWLQQRSGIGCVIDLRTAIEREQQGGYWLSQQPVPVLHMPMQTDVRAAEGHAWQVRLAEMDIAAAQQRSLQSYRQMPAAFRPRLIEVFNMLAAEDAPPLLIHCVLGKDRTGFMTAIMLAALGADWDVILADYLCTAQRIPAREVASRKIAQLLDANQPIPDREVLELLCGVSPEWLTAAFDSAKNQYGSIDDYLTASGADASVRLRLQERLLA